MLLCIDVCIFYCRVCVQDEVKALFKSQLCTILGLLADQVWCTYTCLIVDYLRDIGNQINNVLVCVYTSMRVFYQCNQLVDAYTPELLKLLSEQVVR